MWDEDAISPLRKRLLAARVIDLSGGVDEAMAIYVRIALAELIADGSPAIEIHVSSNGGRLQIGVDMVDMFRHYPGKITGKVFIAAQSAAAVLIQGCDVRLAAPHARILLHHPSDETHGYDDMRFSKQHKKVLAAYEKDSIAPMYAVILRRTGGKMGRKRLRKLCREDRNLTAQEALDLGLIDGILPDKELK